MKKTKKKCIMIEGLRAAIKRERREQCHTKKICGKIFVDLKTAFDKENKNKL